MDDISDKQMLFLHQTLTRVSFDAALVFLFGNGSELRIETNFDVGETEKKSEIPVGQEKHGIRDRNLKRIEIANLAAESKRFVDLLNRVVERIAISEAGELKIEFEGDVVISLFPDPRYEAWNYCDNEGVKVTCLPGGGLMGFQFD